MKLGVPGYTRLDAQLETSLSARASLAVIGQNLADPAHAEFGQGGIVTATLIPRSARVQIGYRF